MSRFPRRSRSLTPPPSGAASAAATSRRAFLQRAGALSAVTISAPLLASCSGPPAALAERRPGTVSPAGNGGSIAPADTEPEQRGRVLPGAVDGRILVVVDLKGGNDGLSTVVPAGDARYRNLRPRLALPEDEVLALDDRVGLHPALQRLHRRGITTVEGVGPINGDLSHFAMTERWEWGDVDGTNPFRTGFLGRLADTLDDSSPLVGVSLDGPSPHLVADQAATLSFTDPGQLWFLRTDVWDEVAPFRSGLDIFEAEATGPWADALRGAHTDLLDLADRLPEETGDEAWAQEMISEGGWLGQQLRTASHLIEADLGTRVIYAGLDGFDTHDDHEWRHPQLMGQLDAAVGGFLDRMDDIGRADQVLVATISEFGRRVPENGEGLDHGSASAMLVAGPVADRRLGEAPPIDALDQDDNLETTISFDRYLASLAEDWLGVEAASVLPDAPDSLGLLA